MIKEANIYSDSDENQVFAIISKCLMRTSNGEPDNELTELKNFFPNLNMIGINSEAIMGHDCFPGIEKAKPTKINQLNYEATFYDPDSFMDSSIYTFISVKN